MLGEGSVPLLILLNFQLEVVMTRDWLTSHRDWFRKLAALSNQSSLIRVRMMRHEHAFCNLQHNFVDTACGSCAWDQNRNLVSLCLKDHGIRKFWFATISSNSQHL